MANRRPGEPPIYGDGRAMPPALRAELAAMPISGRYRLASLVTYYVRDGRVGATFHLPGELSIRLQAAAERDQKLRIAIEGFPQIWTLRRYLGSSGRGPFSTELTCYDPGNAPFQRFSVRTGVNGTLWDASAFEAAGRPRPLQLTLSEAGRRVRILRYLPPYDLKPCRQMADSLTQFWETDHEIANAFVVPLLRGIGGGHLLHRRPAADVYRAFPEIMPDPSVTREVETLVAHMDAPEAAERESAMAAMILLGRPAAAALLRLDFDSLSPEQQARVRKLLAEDDWRRAKEISGARKDLYFLADCLDDDDPVVRAVALRSFESAIGRPMHFDPEAPEEARTAAADTICDQLHRVEQLRSKLVRK